MKYYFTAFSKWPFISNAIPWCWQDALTSLIPCTTPTSTILGKPPSVLLMGRAKPPSSPSPASGHLLSRTFSFSSSANLPRLAETLAQDEQKAERLAGFLSYPSPKTKFKEGCLLRWGWGRRKKGQTAFYVKMSPQPQMNLYPWSWKVGPPGVREPLGTGSAVQGLALFQNWVQVYWGTQELRWGEPSQSNNNSK